MFANDPKLFFFKMNPIKVALVQAPLVWENPAANRSYFQKKINEIVEPIELIVLPEMFTTGFSMNPKPIAETMNGETIRWLQTIAYEQNCAITGSIVVEENCKFFNRMLFVYPYGKIDFYDKKHLFSLAGEQHQYTPGSDRKIMEYRGFKICVLICYDLRFPVFSRNTDDYDLLIFVANWPKPRINAWDALLKARAIENMSYCIGVNRTGQDANQNDYCGHTQALDFFGHYVLEPQTKDGVFMVELDKKTMLETRQKFGFLNDKDSFRLV